MPFEITRYRPTGTKASVTYAPNWVTMEVMARRAVSDWAYEQDQEGWNSAYPHLKKIGHLHVVAFPMLNITIGPFIDGSKVQTRDIQWRTLCDRTGLPYPGCDHDRENIIREANRMEAKKR